jgi:amino-acid N-acetyltransferase
VHIYPDEHQAELACLHVAKNQEGQGHGRKLMAFAEQLAVEKGVTQLFALSTQAFNYFQQKGGFIEATPEVLPSERRKKYEVSGRNSKVLIKPVSPSVVMEALTT